MNYTNSMNRIYYIIAGVVVAAVALYFIFGREAAEQPQPASVPTVAVQVSPISSSQQTFDFSDLNSVFRFSGKLPEGLTARYVPAIEAIDISNQIFIRHFEADRFLTLSTVNILLRREGEVNGHAAVWYEIDKKAGVPDFPNQPAWRSQRHKLVDIRLTANSPSVFYVIAYNPEFSEHEFNKFLEGLVFHNDPGSFRPPLPDAEDRITKKPFGILVSPDNSPVQPEKFSGYHTGTDFEVFESETNSDTEVAAICGGKLKARAQAQGYGGYAVQECLLDSQILTVVYGHLKLSSIALTGVYLAPGDKVGLLGAGFSSETDNERKHLHLSIIKGFTNDIRGYVQNQSELFKWLNPEKMLRF